MDANIDVQVGEVEDDGVSDISVISDWIDDDSSDGSDALAISYGI